MPLENQSPMTYPRKRVIRGILRWIGRLLVPIFFKIEIQGQENYPKRGPAILVGNHNAAMEGVAERVSFERSSAASLPFEDKTFDMVVSNLVFHEVRDVRDKSKLIQEALRVVKSQGRFVFQDLFLWKQVYGNTDDLLKRIWSWGIASVTLLDTSVSDFIPGALKLPFMLGTVGLLFGRK